MCGGWNQGGGPSFSSNKSSKNDLGKSSQNNSSSNKTSTNLVTRESKSEPEYSDSDAELTQDLTKKLTAVQTNVNFGLHLTLRAECIGPKARATVNLIYDSGSPISMIEEKLAKT